MSVAAALGRLSVAELLLVRGVLLLARGLVLELEHRELVLRLQVFN